MGAMFCYFKGCTKCGGDLIFDEGDWKCWQCGQYYYRTSATTKVEVPSKGFDEGELTVSRGWSGATCPEPIQREKPPRRGGRRGYGGRASRNINSLIRAKEASDRRWWARNRQIIEYLHEHLPVREISRLIGVGERQIRIVRERLADIRSATEDGSPEVTG